MKQHYVPVAHLRGFCLDFPDSMGSKRKDLSTYLHSKSDLSVKRKGVNNILNETDYYTFQGEGDVHPNIIEDNFQEVEDEFGRLLRLFSEKLKKGQNLLEIFEDGDNVRALVEFVGFQYKRVPRIRDGILKEMIEKETDFEESTLRNMANQLMFNLGNVENDNTPSLFDVLGTKNWYFYVCNLKNKRFIGSDDPVYMLEGTGVANEKVEICFPVNERLFLIMQGSGQHNNVHYLTSSQKHLEFIKTANTKTYLMSREYCVSSSELLLKSLGKRLKGHSYNRGLW